MRERERGRVGLPGGRRVGNKIVAPSFASAVSFVLQSSPSRMAGYSARGSAGLENTWVMPFAERPAHRERYWQKSNATVG